MAVAEVAGRNLKKVVLEMGGSDPFIVLSADNLDEVVDNAIAARLDNTGQSCNAAKRFIVAENLYDDFVARFTEKMLANADGITPLSSQAAADRLQAQVDAAVADGAKLASAGERRGAFFPVGVLTDISEDNAAFHQELFGPVAMVFKASSEEDAVRLANDTPFGLGSYVFTTDPEQAARGGPDRRRHGLHQRRAGRRGGVAVRRHQALRVRSRDGHAGHRRIRQQEVDPNGRVAARVGRR